MQKQIILDTSDNKKIYGVWDKADGERGLVVVVHGLTGHKNEHIFYNAAKFLNQKGLSVFRFDLYSDETGGRKLHECGISTHSRDLNTVLEHFRPQYQTIHLIGHSLGGPVILGADLDVISRIVLWDPSGRLNPATDGEWYEYNDKLDAYVIKWGIHYLAGKELIKEWENLDYQQWLKNCRVPLKVICAGNGILKNKWKNFINDFSGKTDFQVIAGASHCFDETGVEERLFEETAAWLS